MKLIVGLGNPGAQYEYTRHNVGFFMIEKLREDGGLPDWSDSRFRGVVSEGVYGGEKVILLKPTTYMNLSGESVSAVVHYYKIDRTDILVLVDDLDMDFGKVRYRSQGSSGGQNGLKSLIEHLGTDEFARVKIGIGRDPRYSVSDWVLSRFTIAEREKLSGEVWNQVSEKITKFLTHT